ncbi:MAG: carbonic anhydrase, partial [Nitrospinales bacterium]
MTSQESLKQLIEGNRRFITGKPLHPNQSLERRKESVSGQSPIAAILGCSDSRVSPEIVFDQGIGDLFVLRVAGNVADDPVLGSLEYAVEHLNVPLIIVLGHSACGAVIAAAQGGEFPGKIGSLTKAIAPAVEKAKGKEGDAINNAVKENIKLIANRLAASEPVLEEK